MAEVLLIQPPIRDFYLTKKRTVPYGLLSIAASLIKSGFTTEIFDGLASPKSRVIELPTHMRYLLEFYPAPDLSPFGLFHHFRHYGYSFQHIGQIARRSSAFLVGISSLFTAYSEEALQTASAVRKAHPNCKIVLGGHHPTQLPEEVIRHPAVDYVLRGEAEESLPCLARTIMDGTPLESVPGIVFQKEENQLTIAEPAIAKDLDRLPIPALKLMNHRFYQRAGRNSMVVSTSRGCPMKCTYCSVGASSSIPYRRRDLSNLIHEIEEAIEKYNVRLIDFEDENLTLSRRWFLSLMTEIRSRFSDKSLELRAMNGLLPSSLDGEMIKSMGDTGFKTLNLSLCSTSKAQLNRYQRKDTISAFENALKVAENYNMDAIGYIIIGGPGQEADQSADDLLYLASKRVLAGVSVFYPTPGSIEYENCKNLDLLPSKFSLMRSTALPIFHTTSRVETATLLRLGRILNFMKAQVKQRPNSVDQLSEISTATNHSARIEQGNRILNHFFKTGDILGIDPDGNRYEHVVSKKLTRQFINGLKTLRIKSDR